MHEMKPIPAALAMAGKTNPVGCGWGVTGMIEWRCSCGHRSRSRRDMETHVEENNRWTRLIEEALNQEEAEDAGVVGGIV